MDPLELAGQAIEEMVAQYHPGDSQNWSAIVPMENPPKGWGLELARWGTEATIIIDRYCELLGADVEVPNSAIRTAGNKRLDMFQDYLEAKASFGFIKLSYFRSKALLLGWEG